MPADYGGAGLGITEAALMMQTISASGAGLSGASAVHMKLCFIVEKAVGLPKSY
jgi:acyl-CoA dehydrogenase